MDAGDVATWVGSTAAVVAAVASVAVWWRERPVPAWELQYETRGVSLVRNTGRASAKEVRVRAGSASRPMPNDHRVDAGTIAPGEVIPIIASRDMGDPADWAVEVTWRGRRGRRAKWTRPIV